MPRRRDAFAFLGREIGGQVFQRPGKIGLRRVHPVRLSNRFHEPFEEIQGFVLLRSPQLDHGVWVRGNALDLNRGWAFGRPAAALMDDLKNPRQLAEGYREGSKVRALGGQAENAVIRAIDGRLGLDA